MPNAPDITSQWYPYYKVQEGFFDLSDTVNIPRKICDYLLDAPKGDYKPIDDNKYSRARFWKYLYYDKAHPLGEKLPTIKEKMKVLFNPDKPTEPPTDKGYRLIPQIYIPQSQEIAQSRVNVYMGRTVASNDEFTLSLSVVFDIWTHNTYELNTRQDEYSRTLGIEQALIEAFHGVNMAGIGTFSFSKACHPDCGSKPISDGKTNVGRELIIGLEVATTTPKGIGQTDNMVKTDDNSYFW